MPQKLSDFIFWINQYIGKKFHLRQEHMEYYLSIVVSLLLFIISLIFFWELTEELKENDLGFYDQYFSEKIQNYRNPSITTFYTFITRMGDRLTYILLSLVFAAFFLIWTGKWKFALQTTLVLCISSISNIILKQTINRERPTIDQLITVTTLSFPSGHAMSAMAFYGFLIYLGFRLGSSWGIKLAIFFILGLLILLIGISRIYLGVHYPSDVLAGFTGGLIWVSFFITLFTIRDLYKIRHL
jgi:undecaprenyl-diphosphatase